MPENIQLILTEWGLKTIYVIAAFIIGSYIIKLLSKVIKRLIKKSKLDPSVESFLLSFIRIALKVLLIVTIIGILGLPTTSFAAIIGAGGLALGLALQGSLSNFAGGVLILVLKPFVVGDYIDGGGHAGTVTAITIFYTYMNTIDNKVIMIPNGNLSNNSIVNYSKNEKRRVDMVFGVSYDSDVDEVKKVIGEIINNHELIIKDPEPFVRLGKHNNSSLDYTVRVWTKASDYFTVYFDLNEQIKKAFDENNIEIPYPHMVNIVKND